VDELVGMKCEACRTGSPRVDPEEIDRLRSQIPDWLVVEREDIKRLERTFLFRDFAEALFFTNQVGELAEDEGHHPALLTEWGSVTVTWWTHKIRGLHRNDFIAAAKTDRIAGDVLQS
jgi:4a-hydroxytetrahydrobiopterin dehydratase